MNDTCYDCRYADIHKKTLYGVIWCLLHERYVSATCTKFKPWDYPDKKLKIGDN
jgi:hypothetical protein